MLTRKQRRREYYKKNKRAFIGVFLAGIFLIYFDVIFIKNSVTLNLNYRLNFVL